MILDHEPLEISDFGGVWGRDSFGDSTPADHAIDSLNVVTSGDELKTRDGFPSVSITLANIRRMWVYKREGEAPRLLILNNNYQIFDSVMSLVTPILTVTGMLDFSVEFQYNRAYISPHNGIKGLAGEKVYVYSGSGLARAAAGLAPVAGPALANSASAGNVEAGLHIFAICYETDSGFITPPGPATTLQTDGTRKVDLGSIPIGPAGTAKRRIIASRAIQDYNGDDEGYEMFFVPDGTINNNSATTATINFFDADLQVTADYTYDQLETIPACLFFAKYKNMLCFGGENTNPSMLRVSKATEPESVNEAAGFIVFDPHETEGIKSGLEFRDNLYVTKGNPGHTYSARDNGYEPSTWNAPSIDMGIGADLNGMSQFVDSKGASSDFYLAADVSGLFVFDGSYNKQNPLSFKIDNLWKRINKAVIQKSQLILDPKRNLIYFLAPLDSATTPSHIFVGDYDKGLNWKDIRWHVWTLSGSISPVAIVVDLNHTTAKTYLRVAGYAGNVYNQEEDIYNDNAEAYENYTKFALMNTKAGYVHSFAGVRFRITGSGTLSVNAQGLDGSNSTNLPSLTMATAPGVEKLLQLVGWTNEKCSIKIRLVAINTYFRLRSATLFAKELYATRPA